MRTAILIVSTAVSSRRTPDEIGPALAALAEEAGGDVHAIEVVPHDATLIEDRLHRFVERGSRLILTAGGAGGDPSHATPEATWAVIERETPGVPEAMRAADPTLLLFRGVAGYAGASLVINLPAPPSAARRAFLVVAPLIAHG